MIITLNNNNNNNNNNNSNNNNNNNDNDNSNYQPDQICSCFFGKEGVEGVKYLLTEMTIHLPHGSMRTFDFLFQTETGIYLKVENLH